MLVDRSWSPLLQGGSDKKGGEDGGIVVQLFGQPFRNIGTKNSFGVPNWKEAHAQLPKFSTQLELVNRPHHKPDRRGRGWCGSKNMLGAGSA